MGKRVIDKWNVFGVLVYIGSFGCEAQPSDLLKSHFGSFSLWRTRSSSADVERAISDNLGWQPVVAVDWSVKWEVPMNGTKDHLLTHATEEASFLTTTATKDYISWSGCSQSEIRSSIHPLENFTLSAWRI